jgi:hypothetical protein
MVIQLNSILIYLLVNLTAPEANYKVNTSTYKKKTSNLKQNTNKAIYILK